MEKVKKTNLFLYFCGLTADLLQITYGMCAVWPSSVIPQLQSNNTDVNPLGRPITVLETSIITAIPFAAATFGCVISATIIDLFGRKRSIVILATTITCSLITTAFATHIYIYFVALSVTGICLPGSFISVSIYNSEISEDNNRGKLGCLVSLSVPFGCCLAYIIGPNNSVKHFTLLCALPALLSLLLSPLRPESPIILVKNKKISESIKALEKLRNTKDAKVLELEYRKIEATVKVTTTANQRSYMDLAKDPALRKALFLGAQVFGAEQFSGILAVLAYAAPIFNKAGSTLSGNNVAMLIGLINLSINLVSIFCIDRLGRRTLLLFSSFFCIFPMFFLGLYFYLKHIKSSLFDSNNWVCILFVVLYITFYSIGLGPVPACFLSEIFPEDLRPKGIALAAIWYNFCCFLVLFGLPLISDTYGIHYCFWAYSLANLISFVSLYLSMPETKGKSFLDIYNYLHKCTEKRDPRSVI